MSLSDVGERCAVLLPLPVKGAYDYRVPAGHDLQTGNFVVVPLGARQVTGVVWGPAAGQVAPEKIKYIMGLVGLPPMSGELMRLIDWIASYTICAPGAVLRMAMNVPAALAPPKQLIAYALADADHDRTAPAAPGAAGESPVRMTATRQRVLDVLAGGPPRPATELAREAAVGPGVVRSLAKAGVLRQMTITPQRDFPVPDWRRQGPVLSAAQNEAASALRETVEADDGADAKFSVTLLDGVTGSGKTEVYFEAVAATLAAGRQALVLLPEIALTAQWLKRFEVRFGAPPVEWHSDLTPARRRDAWRAIAEGRVAVVVGARSALFLPFPDLGLVVVDEEHDTAFKQEEGVIYNARDMAVVRASLGGFPAVLVSATPSLESVVNAERGRYVRLHLPERHAGAALPDIAVIDMRAEEMARQSWLSPTLRGALADVLDAGEQAMLFLNRRGYAPLTLCRACGHRMECPQCTAWLVEHRVEARLTCHHCDFSVGLPRTCPECGALESFAACGPGVERLAEELAGLFPRARAAIMASDTVQSPHAAAELVRRMQDCEIDVLVGTQIMAKGHHFPMLTLVGVIDADLGLAGGDLRAAERTYQLLHQVAGRAGRETRPGKVYLQTCMPDHPVMQALVSGERERFIEAEAAARQSRRLPPFGRLVALIVSGRDEPAVVAAAAALGRTRPGDDGIEVLGPAPAPFAILRGRHRRRLLLKADRGVNVQDVLRRWLDRSRTPGAVRVQVDVDPYSFL
jgi:primosomal protein N' (replication factor Y)